MTVAKDRESPWPGRAASLVEIARRRASEQPSERAYVFLADGEREGAALDFAALDRRARAVAAALQAELAGARAERVLLLHPPGLEQIVDFLACLYADAIPVPTTPPRANRSMRRTQAQALDSGAALVLTVGEALENRERLVASAPALEGLRWLAGDRVPEGAESSWREHAPRGDDLAFLQYTSGSTGTPKGVAVSHANLLHNSECVRLAFRNRPDSTVVSWLPMHHDMGLVGMVLQTLYVGCPLVMMAPAHFLARPARWIEAMSRYRGTMTCAPNFAFDLAADRVTAEGLARLDLTAWEMAVNGSEPVRADTLERFARIFAPCGLRPDVMHPGYGLAEATLLVSLRFEEGPTKQRWVDERELGAGRVVAAEPNAEGAKPLVGCGVTMPGQRIAIVDPLARRERRTGEVGEIWVRGPSVATGYFGRPKESAETFAAHLADTGDGPFLRTGDLGFLDGGELYVAGRRKDVVILHGQNHYPQDLELAAEQSHAGLRRSSAAAFAAELDGRERLVLVAEVERTARRDADAILGAVRGALAEIAEVEASAIALIAPGSLPRTSSGKVRRRATREAWLRAELPLVAEWRAPSESQVSFPPVPSERSAEAILAWLARLVASSLGVPPGAIDPAATLATQGLDSLRTVRLSHVVERELGTALPLSRLYEGATLAGIAAELASASPRAPLCPVAAEPGHVPLSYGQRSLWFLHRMAPAGAAYHVCVAARLLTPLDARAFERALAALASRHAVLRTTFTAGPDGEPRPRVHESLPPAWERVDARGASDAEVAERAAALARRPFDLEQGPLFRASWLWRDGAPDVLVLAAHHVVLDHWSLTVVLSDLAELYAAEREARDAALPPPASHEAFARRQRAWLASPGGEAAWRFWRAELDDAPEPAEIPSETGRSARRAPPEGRRGRTVRATLDPALAERVRAFAREREVTPYLVTLAAFEVAMQRATGRERFLFGTLASGRSAAEDAELVGYLVNPLVLRADLSGRPGFEGALERARRRAARVFAHADFPFPLLVERLRPARDADRTPFLRTLFVWQHAHAREASDLGALVLGMGGARVRLGELELESIELDLESAQFDLSLTLAEVDGSRGLALALELDADLFEEASAHRFLARYVRLLEAVLAEPGRAVADIPLFEEGERERVLELWEGPPLGRDSAGSLHPRLALHAERAPDAVAVVAGERRVGYAELRARVERLARRLLERGVGIESVVCVLAERSLERCVALLAVHAAGAAWVPIDPALPLARQRRLARDAGACLVAHLGAPAPDLGLPPLRLDESGPCPAEEPFEPAAAPLEAAAYVMHTSGSSGAPKGVVISRRALHAHAVGTASALGLGARDTVLHMASVGFDLSVEELFATIAAGARLVVHEPSAPPSAAELHAIVEREGVTVLDLPTAYWHAWTAALAGERVPRTVRLVIAGGERASASSLAAWRRAAHPSVRWINSYGPTEATVGSTFYEPSPPEASAETPPEALAEIPPEAFAEIPPEALAEIPIGRAVPGWRVGVVDDAWQPLPPGVPGQIAIGGLGVARGYLGHPRLTARVFVPDPFSPTPGGRMFLTGDHGLWRADGQLAFLGRSDEQIKVRGFRVEPGEVLAELSRERGVSEAAVVPRVGPDGSQQLVAYAVTGRDPEDVRSSLAARLPHYLVPARVVALEALPRTRSGKIDRRALPDPEPLTSRSSEDARGSAEETLARLWKELLGAPRVGRLDDFFELGGDSIRSIQLAARAAAMGLELSPQDVFRHPRLADLARAARRAHRRETRAPATGPVPLTPIQRWFFEAGLASPERYSQYVLLESANPPALEHLRRALEHLARRHESLRLRFPNGSAHAVLSDAGSAVLAEAVRQGEGSPPEHEAAWTLECERVKAGLDPERGPLLRAALFPAIAGRSARLLVVAHHLVIDAVSWRLAVDELEEILSALERGEQPPERDAGSWCAWARWLDARARSIGRDELDLACFDAPPPAPRALGADPGREGEAGALSTDLGATETGRLERAARGDRGGVEELLVAALATALCELDGRAETALELEAHGRPGGPGTASVVRGGAGAPDVSRTIGWFTELFPATFDLAGAASPLERLDAVRADLAAARRRGARRWLARYGGNEALARELREVPSPAVSFNYLGSFDGAIGRSRFRLLAAGAGRARAARRTHALEIDARVERGSLRVDWSHGPRARAAVERLAAAFASHLGELCSACERAVGGGARPAAERSDLAALDRGQLARVLAQLERGGRELEMPDASSGGERP